MAMMQLAVLFALLPLASPAGMTTHTVAGYRAINYYGAITSSPRSAQYNAALASHPEAAVAGADFPDFLYACGKYKDHHDAGEFAHWPPFHKAMVQYINDTRADFHTGSWADGTNKLVAFLMGTGTHFMADELWEGMISELSAGQGMVRIVSSTNLGHDGKSDNDEGVANMAADFYLPWALDTSSIHPWRREYPLDDVLRVYTNYTQFTDVTEQSLTNCKVLFDLGLWAEMTFGGLLFPWYVEAKQQVPIMAENLIDMPLAGIDDMAIWATNVWERLANWLDVGPPETPPPNRRLLSLAGNDNDDRFTHDFLGRFAKFAEWHDDIVALEPGNSSVFEWKDPSNPFDGVVYTGPTELRGVLTEMLGELITSVFKPDELRLDQIKIHDLPDDLPIPEMPVDDAASLTDTISGNAAVGYVGAAVASGDLNGDGSLDLIYSEYGSGEKGRAMVGEVTVVYGGGGNASTMVLKGEAVHSWFGKTVLVMDLNLDGVDDLVVGAPHAGWNDTEIKMPYDTQAHFRFWGKVYVYFGHKAGLQESPDLTVSTNQDLTGLGWVLRSGDLNADGRDDLVMGCPLSSRGGTNQQGHVFGLFASTRQWPGQMDLDSSCDVSIPGPSNYDWFGMDAAVTTNGRLLVGAPGHRVNTTSTVGCVYQMEMANASSGAWEVTATVVGAHPLGEFGHSIAVDKSVTPNLVAVSAPASSAGIGKLRVGEVWVMDTPLTSGVVADSNPVAHVVGDHMLARFGWTMGFVDLNADNRTDLVVGSPLANGILLYNNREAGALSVWLKPLSGESGSGSADLTVKGSRRAGRLGSSWAVMGKNAMAIGAPRATVDGKEMAGVVELHQFS